MQQINAILLYYIHTEGSKKNNETRGTHLAWLTIRLRTGPGTLRLESLGLHASVGGNASQAGLARRAPESVGDGRERLGSCCGVDDGSAERADFNHRGLDSIAIENKLLVRLTEGAVADEREAAVHVQLLQVVLHGLLEPSRAAAAGHVQANVVPLRQEPLVDPDSLGI